MRRILLVIAVAALMAVMMAAMAAPAFAASETGNCVGELSSLNNQLGKDAGAPGSGGLGISNAGAAGILGDIASSNECP